MTSSYFLIKRGFELIFVALCMLFMGPFILLAALAVWLEDWSASPFLKQERIGLGERSFQLLKLRTMRPERYRNGKKLPDADRLLGTGRLFRKLSID